MLVTGSNLFDKGLALLAIVQLQRLFVSTLLSLLLKFPSFLKMVEGGLNRLFGVGQSFVLNLSVSRIGQLI